MLLPNISENTKILTELSFQNIICYYQTLKRSFLLLSFLYFKTSYVITKQQPVRWYEFDYLISKHHMLLPNLSPSVTVTSTSSISKHHMLLPNAYWTCYGNTTFAFQNIICYYQTHGFKPSFNPLIPWKPLNHGIFFKFYQPTPNFRNDS